VTARPNKQIYLLRLEAPYGQQGIHRLRAAEAVATGVPAAVHRIHRRTARAAMINNPAARKAVLLNRSALLAAWPRYFPRHDFLDLRFRSPPSHADSYWEGESWKQAAAAYHAERKLRPNK
jgi:hypothetical protein